MQSLVMADDLSTGSGSTEKKVGLSNSYQKETVPQSNAPSSSHAACSLHNTDVTPAAFCIDIHSTIYPSASLSGMKQ